MTKMMDEFENVIGDLYDTPLWAQEMITELKAIRSLLEEQKSNRKPYNFYDFINTFRKEMQADVEQGRYPEIEINKRRVGVTKVGLLYDKATSDIIERAEAFSIYKSLYKRHQRSPLF